MSHQTPVARVVPAWHAWLQRWPTPTALADDSPGEAVRMWGRLGYPRRALRLHAAAVAVRDEHDGQVPTTYEALLGLPGVGPYTAGATAAFAHGRRAVVLDVNIRRVLSRVHEGVDALPSAPARAEVARAERLLPGPPPRSVAWNAAVMELGAVVCTARAPRCDECPLRDRCRWAALAPPPDGAADATARGRTTRPQAWVGTDRYVRGLLLAALREETGVVPAARLEAVWPDQDQTARCLTGLLADGLAEAAVGGYRLPT
ncbi:A/G-specific adenine glycosylase [Aquipuribacter sp. MA13-6]|uniref:A/G-specific adenine glycosylase n=1 Tax=unclassified Aquipuribacter TaxID=2635084 RepID=UPI003EEC10BF